MASGPLQEKIEASTSVANSLAPCLFGRRQVQVRAFQSFKVSDRVRYFSWTSRSAYVGCWVSVVCNFLKAAEDDETYLDDNIRHPATRWQRRSQISRATGCGVGACWRYVALVPENVSSSRGSEFLGSSHYDQSNDTLEQEGKASGAHSRREERSWASTRKEVKGQDRRKERKEQKSALHSRSRLCTVVFSVGISVVGHVASFHQEAHVRRAEFTNAPRVGQTSTRQGSVHRLD